MHLRLIKMESNAPSSLRKQVLSEGMFIYNSAGYALYVIAQGCTMVLCLHAVMKVRRLCMIYLSHLLVAANVLLLQDAYIETH